MLTLAILATIACLILALLPSQQHAPRLVMQTQASKLKEYRCATMAYGRAKRIATYKPSLETLQARTVARLNLLESKLAYKGYYSTHGAMFSL